MENNRGARRRISALFSEYTHHLLEVTQIKDPKTVRICMTMFRDGLLRRIEKETKFSTEMKAYAKNVIRHRYKAFSQGYESINTIIQNRPKTS